MSLKRIERRQNLISEIEKTLDDSEIKNNKEIVDFLLSCKKSLEKNDGYKYVCSRLSYFVTKYVQAHNLKAPSALMNLHSYIETSAQSYKMFGFASMFL